MTVLWPNVFMLFSHLLPKTRASADLSVTSNHVSACIFFTKKLLTYHLIWVQISSKLIKPYQAAENIMTPVKMTPDFLNELSKTYFPGHLGIQITHASPGKIEAELKVEQRHHAPNGFLHAGSVVTLADTCAGYGCMEILPEGATGFTTIELKSNFLGTVMEGTIECKATARHTGGMTQVWDAVVSDKNTERTIALFRCTQMILYK